MAAKPKAKSKRMNPAQDDKLDRKAGIKEFSKRDLALDKKRGIKDDMKGKAKANPFGKRR